MNLPILDFAETIAALPPQQTAEGLDEAIRKALTERYDVVIILDDDPTGTQTVYDVPVITEWTKEAISAELNRGGRLFYILTNSRAIPGYEATGFAYSLGERIREVCNNLQKRPLVIIRGDSTLRGHFKYEDEWLASGLKSTTPQYILAPAFLEGGRYTINDVHYVQEEGLLIPAGQTPFAQDSSFAYISSDLKEWIIEKSDEVTEAPVSISLEDLRKKKPLAVRQQLRSIKAGQVLIVNAADYTDLKRAALAILSFTKHPQLRTSASFIKALLGQPDRPLLTFPKQADRGGLIVVGSHVPKTTAQLRHLRANHEPVEFEVNVRELLALQFPPSGAGAERQMGDIAPAALAQKMAKAYSSGQNVLLFTSREVITTNGKDANLDIAATVSAYLEAVVAALPSAPAFLLTKGGITSSRIATESLGVKRAMAIGQVLPGVPAWELGPESKFPGMPFIIFPGNVGEEDSLSRILQNTFI